jgi:transcriptional regulator with XRE-family HTH domain
MNDLSTYIRRRAKELGLTITELCRRAEISRQTLYALQNNYKRLPSLDTIVVLAQILKTHPLQLLNLLFATESIPTLPSKRLLGDDSTFIQDLTFPDGERVAPNQWITKSWEMKNSGTVVWKGRHLVCIDETLAVFTRLGDSLKVGESLEPLSNRIAVPETKPGESVKLSVKLLTPSQPGTVLSYWKTVFSNGSYCFPSDPGLWCKVRVDGETKNHQEGIPAQQHDQANAKAKATAAKVKVQRRRSKPG